MRDLLPSWVERDREIIVNLLQEFVRVRSPNPPGDTRYAMTFVRQRLDDEKLSYKLVTRDETMPNLVASKTFGAGKRHLVLNGHIDVFPVENPESWSTDPWSGSIVDGAIYGRGISDMKVGTLASILTYIYLSRIETDLRGRLTLTVVSDEETFGPNGARHLFDICPEDVKGTSCLVGEPSSAKTVRFGEKGALWIRFAVKTPGGHGAYPHLSPNAIDLAYDLIQSLKELTKEPFIEPREVSEVLDRTRSEVDAAYGLGASDAARAITLNIGTMTAGPKVNMIASNCTFEADFRLPNGVDMDRFKARIDALKEKHAFSYEIIIENHPNWCEPNGELAQIVRRNAHSVTGEMPVDTVGLGNTDARLWRYHAIPAVVYGPAPIGMGSSDERVSIEEALNVIKCHLLSAYDYLNLPDT